MKKHVYNGSYKGFIQRSHGYRRLFRGLPFLSHYVGEERRRWDFGVGQRAAETRTPIKALADMYAAGGLTRNSVIVMGIDKVAEMIAAGKSGIDFGEQWTRCIR